MNNKSRILLISGLSLLGIIILSVSTVVIKNNVIKAYKLPSKSMEPTLLVGDCILVDRSQLARNPHQGDLIVFKDPKDPTKDFVKRVVAVGGDTVEIRNKNFLLNGKAVNEAYVIHQEADMIPASQNPRDNFGPQTIPADSYFVMGDNRDRSYDSRFLGVVSKHKVEGTVKFIYWSWDREKLSVRWDRIGTNVL